MSLSLLAISSHGLFGTTSGGDPTPIGQYTLLDQEDVRNGTQYYYDDILYVGNLTKTNFDGSEPAETPTFDGVTIALKGQIPTTLLLTGGLM